MKNKKVERETVEMPFGYKVGIHQYCNHSEREDVEYGSWSESYTNSIDPMIVAEEQYPDVITLHELKPGDRAFVVWAEWSTGDSFGHGVCSSVEAIGLFTKYEDAEVLKAVLLDTESYADGKWSSTKVAYWVKTPDGQIFENGFAPWCGYFETLEEIHIDRVEVR